MNTPLQENKKIFIIFSVVALVLATVFSLVSFNQPTPTANEPVVTGPCAVDVAVVIDQSDSMKDHIGEIAQAVDGALDAVDMRNKDLDDSLKDRVGYIRFSLNASVVSPLTNNYASITVPKVTDNKGSNLGQGILKATQMLGPGTASRERAIVMLSDGRANAFNSPGKGGPNAENGAYRPGNKKHDIPDKYYLDQMKAAKAAGIKIYTIGYGNKDEVHPHIMAGESTAYIHRTPKHKAALQTVFSKYLSLACDTQPVHPPVEITDCVQPVDFTFVLDNSGSMWRDQAFPGTKDKRKKIAALQDATDQVLDDLNSINQQIDQKSNLNQNQKDALKARAAVVSFNNTATQNHGLTYTMSDIKNEVDKLQPYHNDPNQGETNLGDGVAVGHTSFNKDNNRASAKKVMIVLTDGVATMYKDGDSFKHDIEPYTKANDFFKQEAIAARTDSAITPAVEIYSVGYGAPGTGMGFTETVMKDQQVSGPSKTTDHNDHYFNNPVGSDVDSVFVQIVNQVCSNPPEALGVTLTAVPSDITLGLKSTLTWTSTGNPDQLILSSDKDQVITDHATNPNGAMDVSPQSTTVYTIKAVKSGVSSVTAQATVNVTTATPSPTATPVVTATLTLQADKTQIEPGGKVLLTYTYTNTSNQTIHDAVIATRLPDGLVKDADGQPDISLPVGDVAAGATGTVSVLVRHAIGGQQ